MSFVTLRRLFAGLGLLLAVVATSCTSAEGLRPFEPLNPAKAQSLPTSPLTIQSGGKSYPFTVELADTDTQRNIGLMHRNDMDDDHGMLFDFHNEQKVAFWMRNTFIALDMIFILSNGEIVAIADNTVPHSEKPVGPARPVQAVLEVPAGTTGRLHIKVGDVVHHRIFNNAP